MSLHLIAENNPVLVFDSLRTMLAQEIQGMPSHFEEPPLPILDIIIILKMQLLQGVAILGRFLFVIGFSQDFLQGCGLCPQACNSHNSILVLCHKIPHLPPSTSHSHLRMCCQENIVRVLAISGWEGDWLHSDNLIIEFKLAEES